MNRVIAPVTRPRWPLSSVTPFTYRDNATYLEILENVRRAVDDVIKNENEQTGFLNENVKAQADKIDEILGQLVGYTIEISDLTYKASMMDGSTFESYTIEGVNQQIGTLESQVATAVQELQQLAADLESQVTSDLSDVIADVGNTTTNLTNYVNNSIDALQNTVADDLATFQQNVNQQLADFETTNLDGLRQGNWIIGNGEQNLSMGVTREWNTENGALFNAVTTIGLTHVGQASTDHVPPGYSQAQLYLQEQGDHGFDGATTYVRLISNRILINRRLEILEEGGLSRAFIRVGGEGRQTLQFRFHNITEPSVTLHGPNDPSSTPSALRVVNARFLIYGQSTNPVTLNKTDDSGRAQHLGLVQFGTGAQGMRAMLDGVTHGQVLLEPNQIRLVGGSSDPASIRIQRGKTIVIDGNVIVNGTITEQ